MLRTYDTPHSQALYGDLLAKSSDHAIRVAKFLESCYMPSDTGLPPAPVALQMATRLLEPGNTRSREIMVQMMMEGGL